MAASLIVPLILHAQFSESYESPTITEEVVVEETVSTSTEPEIKEEIVYDNDILFKICTCESGMGTGQPQHYESDGVTVLTGRIDPRDTGMCQINKFYHLETSIALGFDINTPEGNWGYAEHLFATQGVQPWRASESCWNN